MSLDCSRNSKDAKDEHSPSRSSINNSRVNTAQLDDIEKDIHDVYEGELE